MSTLAVGESRPPDPSPTQPLLPEQQLSDLKQSVRQATPDQTLREEQIETMILTAHAYQQTHPGFVGKVAGKDHNLERSFLASKEGRIFLLMTRHEKKGDPLLGKGQDKKVKCAIDLTTNRVYAVGVMRLAGKSASKRKRYEREVAVMELLKGVPRTVQLISSLVANEKLYLVMDYCEKGSLESALNTRCVRESTVRIAKNCLEGLTRIHRKKILHRDIKPSNVLLSYREGRIRAKLGDFGLSCQKEDVEERKKISGTPLWYSPEAARACFFPDSDLTAMRASDYPSDVWAMGALLYYLFTEEHFGFQLVKDEGEFYCTLFGLRNDEITPFIRQNPRIPHSYRQIIIGMLNVDPVKRFTAEKAYQLA